MIDLNLRNPISQVLSEDPDLQSVFCFLSSVLWNMASDTMILHEKKGCVFTTQKTKGPYTHALPIQQ
jgi:hypothetical protein